MLGSTYNYINIPAFNKTLQVTVNGILGMCLYTVTGCRKIIALPHICGSSMAAQRGAFVISQSLNKLRFAVVNSSANQINQFYCVWVL